MLHENPQTSDMLRSLGAASQDDNAAHRARRLQLTLTAAIAAAAVATLGSLLR